MWNESWPSLKLLNFRRSLDGVVALVATPQRDQIDDVTRALTRFLVVRTCGYLELATEESCKAFLKGKSLPSIAAYGGSWLGRGTMPLPGTLVALTTRFDVGWGEELQTLLKADDEQLWREVTHLVELRKKVAHGGSEGTSARKALDLADSAKTIADWFINRFDPR